MPKGTKEGVLGVGYKAIESRVTFSEQPQYDNLPVLLVKQGLIASRAFSLWTNDDRASGGTLLFGCVASLSPWISLLPDLTTLMVLTSLSR
jgi:hypothetical protein